MPDSASVDLTTHMVIAHQLPAALAKGIAENLPGDVSLVALGREDAWLPPKEAEILVAIPPRGGNVMVPDSPPPGWPGNLKWILAVSTGVDEYPRWAFDGPVVTCGRGLNSRALGEFVLASILAVEKHFPEIWIGNEADWTHRNLGSLYGKTVGVLGFGGIGKEVARLARAFGMSVLAYRRSNAPSEVEDVQLAGLSEVISRSDHLVVALPLTPETRHLLNEETLSIVKRGVHLVNISRGGIVDGAALMHALEDGRVGHASLDVTEPEPLPEGHPFYSHPRVHLSPHLSYSGISSAPGLTKLFLENLDRYRQGLDLLHRVDPAIGY